MSEGAGAHLQTGLLPADAPVYSQCTKVRQLVFSVVVVSNAAMGAGMLAFPMGFKQAGWGLGVFLVMLFACIQSVSLSIIARCARNESTASYQDMVGKLFGEQAKLFLMCAISVFLFAVCVAYLTVISAQATPILSEWVVGPDKDTFLVPCPTLPCPARALPCEPGPAQSSHAEQSY